MFFQARCKQFSKAGWSEQASCYAMGEGSGLTQTWPRATMRAGTLTLGPQFSEGPSPQRAVTTPAQPSLSPPALSELVCWEQASKISTHTLPSLSSFLCSFIKHVLSVYCVPSPVLGLRMQKQIGWWPRLWGAEGIPGGDKEEFIGYLVPDTELHTRDSRKSRTSACRFRGMSQNKFIWESFDYNLSGSNVEEGEFVNTAIWSKHLLLSCYLRWGLLLVRNAGFS